MKKNLKSYKNASNAARLYYNAALIYYKELRNYIIDVCKGEGGNLCVPFWEEVCEINGEPSVINRVFLRHEKMPEEIMIEDILVEFTNETTRKTSIKSVAIMEIEELKDVANYITECYNNLHDTDYDISVF